MRGVSDSAERGTVANNIYLTVLKETYAEMKAASQITPRHQEWFRGVVQGETPVQDASIERVVAKAVAERMLTVFRQLGGRKYGEFAQKMDGFRHQMQKSVEPKLIPGYISHGACRFGETLEKTKTGFETVRFFVTNGDIELDTSSERYVKLLDSSKDKIMYYGVAQNFDRIGNFVGFDRNKGEEGVMFLTDDPQEALFNIAAISTNRTPEFFRSIALPARPDVAVAVAPRF